MVALPSQMPLITVGRYSLPGCEAAWVEACIRRAASDAGHDDWWFAADIARSVVVYLRDRFPGTAITLEEMNARLRSTLQKIGFTDIGARIALRPEILTVSLHDLAREADGVELLFYSLLEARVTELRELGVQRLSLTEIREGVKHLQSARCWTRSCEDMESMIISYLRVRLASAVNFSVELISDRP